MDDYNEEEVMSELLDIDFSELFQDLAAQLELITPS